MHHSLTDALRRSFVRCDERKSLSNGREDEEDKEITLREDKNSLKVSSVKREMSINVDVVVVPEGLETKRVDRGIYVRLLFLNLVILWSYQSLISAQNYYHKDFPSSHIEFWGTVAAGTSMFVFHVLQLYFGVYRFGFTRRVLPGYIGYIVVAILVMSIHNPYLLIASFAAVGGLNTLTESPIYGLAGLFPTGVYTQAVQVGNGLAGVLNVSANALIRLIVYFARTRVNPDQLSFYIFMSLLVCLCLVALYHYFALIRLPAVNEKLGEQKKSFLQVTDDVLSYGQLFWILKIHLFVQFYVLFISLLLWPGVPCGATKSGWFKYGGALWWCSPFVIGTFNFGDLLGRTLALRVHHYFSAKICFFSSLVRSLFLLIFVFIHSMNNFLLLALVVLLGVTNGLLATVTFMVRPSSIQGSINCERAAYLMTAALYAGIAAGSILAVSLSLAQLI